MPISNIAIDSILDGIESHGYAITDAFLSESVTKSLFEEAHALKDAHKMHSARTGIHTDTRLTQNTNNPRGDLIHWLESTELSSAQNEYWLAMQALEDNLNQHFFMGLFDLEAHFAIYPTGSVYKKHLDQFREKKERKVSVILYLNQDWEETDGGQLRIYLGEEDCSNYLDVAPNAGRLVTFLSDRFFHEVLPASRERTSLTGWFRTRSTDIL